MITVICSFAQHLSLVRQYYIADSGANHFCWVFTAESTVYQLYDFIFTRTELQTISHFLVTPQPSILQNYLQLASAPLQYIL
jgi:hypothetical protein